MSKRLTKKEAEKKAGLILSLTKEKKEIEEKIKSLKTDLQDFMTDSEIEELDTEKFLISYTRFVQNRLDTTRLREERPKIYSSYLKETSSSRFDVKEK